LIASRRGAGWLAPRTLGRLGVVSLVVIALVFCFRGTIRGDGVAYYGYLPALLAHHSIDLGPTFDRFIALDTPVARRFLEITLPNGLTADYKPVGAALMALPFYLVTHLVFLLVPGDQDPVAGAEYQLAFTAASLFYGLLALILIYRFCRRLFGAGPAALALAGVVLATPLVAYLLFEPAYSHTFTVFAASAFALYLYETRRQRTTAQWFIAGVLGGLTAITHAQEVLFLLLVPVEAIWQLARRVWTVGLIPRYLVMAAGVLLPILPQLAVDQLLFQRWLPATAPNISFDFLHPHLVELLFSTHHGWLAWSPLVLLSLFGLPAVVRRLEWLGAGLVTVGIAELFVNASVSDWWGGQSFGSRRLTDQSLLVALGLAAACAWLLQRRLAPLAIGLVGAGIAWSGLLLAQYYYVIARDIGPPWADFLLGQVKAIGYVPRLFAQGAILRHLLNERWLLAGYTTLVLAGVVIAALWLRTARFSIIRPGAGRPYSGSSRAPGSNPAPERERSPAIG
jgi:hypothetical protein